VAQLFALFALSAVSSKAGASMGAVAAVAGWTTATKQITRARATAIAATVDKGHQNPQFRWFVIFSSFRLNEVKSGHPMTRVPGRLS
jgi:hypothetical protein